MATVPYTFANVTTQNLLSQLDGNFAVCAVQTGPLSWTPTDNSGASLPFTNVSANYVQIGNMVFVYAHLTYPETASGAGASLAGLPVAVPNHPYAEATAPLLQNVSLSFQTLVVAIPNTSTISLINNAANGLITNAQLSDATINFLLTYPAT